MDNKINPEIIRNILTLRYHPSKNFYLPNLEWQDFEPKDNDDYVEKTESYLKDTIQNFVTKEKPKKISIAISGGVDSIIILTLFRELYPDIQIVGISFGFDENDIDVIKAKEVARKLDVDFKNKILDNLYENLPKQISIIQEPKINYYWYFVAEEAKKHSDFLLTGDGGDELFAGYVFRYSKYLKILKNQSDWLEKTKAYLQCHNRDWVDDQEKIFGPKIKFSWNEIYNLFRNNFENPLDNLEQVLLSDYRGKLMHDWLPAYNKIYDYLDLKGFAPMLDEKVIRFAFSIPLSEKYNLQTNIGKLVLRRILKNKNISVDSNKRGFTPDYIKLWKNFGKNIVKTYLLDGRVIKDGWINLDWVQKAFKKVTETQDLRYINKLLHVTSFEIWYRLFITNEMSKDDKLI